MSVIDQAAPLAALLNDQPWNVSDEAIHYIGVALSHRLWHEKLRARMKMDTPSPYKMAAAALPFALVGEIEKATGVATAEIFDSQRDACILR